ncbi:MAG TPA: RecQ family ATP-dependent DNA helicase [bacterium]|nr:MAG: ATP-dependent DNA helicase RecQ [Parcubacteria group bacterium ADurb.Bin192]HPN15163.1 RecQ family ATP-dependent DNA helicase [bacterium]
MLDKLKKYFGYDGFLPLQEEVIDHIMRGQEALVLMPTGGGKSLCYQLPALELPGVTLVISPLIALMKDQVDGLSANGIKAAYINSSLDYSEIAMVESQVARGEIKLLYLAPERLALPRVQSFLRTLEVSLLAIDEAHCISEWGHDFRPEYRNLHVLRAICPKAKIIALTATANQRVEQDILRQLNLNRARVFKSGFDRPNLSYEVLPKKQVLQNLVKELEKIPKQSAIVYCLSRKRAEKMALDLNKNGFKAACYHAGMTGVQRSRAQEAFIRDRVDVITATIAFGMGIDKPDVRLVAHVDLPKSVEGYYQETGRAGRDGLPSRCLLFFSKGDVFKHEYFICQIQDMDERDRLRRQVNDVIKYGELKTCRRRYLLGYFGETSLRENCGACDICCPKAEVKTPEVQSLVYDKALFEILRDARRRLAEDQGVPPYVIFADKSLQQMAAYYPQTVSSMAGIFGVGREKLERYGQIFIDIIKEYCVPLNLPEKTPRPVTSDRAVKTAVTSTVLATLDLFKSNKSLKQTADLRGLKTAQIITHLETALEGGEKFDWSGLYVPEQRLANIAEAFKNSGGFLLAPARALLGEEYDYDEIRLARLIIKARS